MAAQKAPVEKTSPRPRAQRRPRRTSAAKPVRTTMTLEEALALPRVAICGGSKTGKTTLAKTVTDGRDIIHTDDFLGILPQHGSGAIIAESLENTESFVLEGTKAANALRAGLVVDVAIWLEMPHVERMPGQERQAKAVRTIFEEWVEADGGRTRILEQ